MLRTRDVFWMGEGVMIWGGRGGLERCVSIAKLLSHE